MDQETMQEKLDEQLDKKAAQPIRKPVTVKVIDLTWLMRGERNANNFTTFAMLLKDLPDSIFSSRFINLLLSKYW